MGKVGRIRILYWSDEERLRFAVEREDKRNGEREKEERRQISQGSKN